VGPEALFKTRFLLQIQKDFPDISIVTNTSNGIQGFPDATLFYANNRTAHLEFKKSQNAALQPNQSEWVANLNEKSFARFVYPENADQILEELYAYLNGTEARNPRRE
jgi:hypothetical protein